MQWKCPWCDAVVEVKEKDPKPKHFTARLPLDFYYPTQPHQNREGQMCAGLGLAQQKLTPV